MIIIIDNYDSFTYNLYQILAQLDHTHDPQVIRNDQISVAAIRELRPTAIVLSPGPGKPEDAGICVELIKKLYREIPILGVCLGHQAIATAFGGAVIQADEIVHGKESNIFHHRQNIYHNMPQPFTAGRYHSLIVDKNNLPPTLSISAENETGLIMGINHQQYPVYGVQFHPESILTPSGAKLLRNFIREVGIC